MVEIPEQAVKVAIEAIDDYDAPECVGEAPMKAALTAAAPYMSASARGQALEEAETQGNLKQWNIQDHLKTPGSIAEYLQATLDEGDSELLINAVSDAIRAISSPDHVADAGKVEGDGWLPIETCPPEHVLFFGVDRHGDKVTAEGFKAVNGRLSVGNTDLKPFTFTHWHPIPPVPQTGGGE